MKNIVICDDEADVTREWKAKLEGVDQLKHRFNFLALTMSQLKATIEELEGRRAAARQSASHTSTATEVDDCALLVVDYDLLNAKTGGFVTGENVSYLARCYSGCGVILGLNQFYRDNVFELDLHSRPGSFADVNLSDKQLTVEGLWSADFKQGTFRPWQWPIVPDLSELFEKRVESLKGNLEVPITRFFDFPDTVFDFLDRETQAFISPDAKDIRSVSFLDFVRQSGQGVRGKDEQRNEHQIARIAAARVNVWLERMILPAQSVLVDLPHLIERVPSIIGGEGAIAKQASWVTFDPSPLTTISRHAFARPEWLSRSAWWWPMIESAEEQPELAAPWNYPGLSVAFCEDTSDFRARDQTHPFATAFNSPFARRYVAKLADVIYRPQVRLAD